MAMSIRGRLPPQWGTTAPTIRVICNYSSYGKATRTLHISYSTLYRYFPDFVSSNSIELQQRYLWLEMLGIAEADVSHEWAWTWIFEHLDCSQRGGNQTTLLETLERWNRVAPYTSNTVASDPQYFPHIIAALGLLMSPQYLGYSDDLFALLQSFLVRMLGTSADDDFYTIAATLSALAVIADDDSMLLQGLVSIMQSSQEGENLASWAISDRFCQAYFPISADFQAALGIRGFSQNIQNWATSNLMWPAQMRAPRGRKLLQPPMASNAMPAVSPSMSLAPSFNQRPSAHRRSRSQPSIRGSNLPPGVLMKVAMIHPERVKVDSRLFLNCQRQGLPLRPPLPF